MQTLQGTEVHVNGMAESPVTVSGLTPATTYTISLTLVFMGGDEGTTFLTNATTTEASKKIVTLYVQWLSSLTSSFLVPGDGPRPVMAFPVNQTAVRVTWGPPSLPNGVITSYTIYYATPSDIVLSVGGEVMSHVLQGLRPYTNYTIRISANTSKGEGPSSGGVVVRTLQDGEFSLYGWMGIREFPLSQSLQCRLFSSKCKGRRVHCSWWFKCTLVNRDFSHVFLPLI